MLLTPIQPGPKAGNERARCACEYGPLATRRKRVAFACRCAAWAVGPWADRRVQNLFETGRAYADRSVPLPAVLVTIGEAEAEVAASESRRARTDVFTIFEGLRAGSEAGANRGVRTALSALRWALGTGGVVPAMPPSWDWAHAAVAASKSAPGCEPEWRTPDVLALARLARTGDLGVLPILADALQDAGCDDASVLGHCRAHEGEHVPGCWVPDLIFGAD